MQPLVEVLTNPQWLWTALAIFGTAILQVAAAVWAAGSRRHWFVRALVLWGAVALLVPIRAYEPALLFAISSPLTVLIVHCWRAAMYRWRPPAKSEASKPAAAELASAATPRGRFNFRLVDLFLLMAIAGLWLAVVVASVRNVRVLEWSGPIRYIAAFTIAGIAAFAVVFGQRRRFWTYAAAAAATSAAVYLFWNSSDWLLVGEILGGGWLAQFFGPLDRPLVEISTATAILASAVVVLLWRWSSPHGNSSADQRSWRRLVPRAALAFIALLATPFYAAIYWQMLWLTPLPSPIDDSPNHFARIVQIAEGVARSKQDEQSLADLRAANPTSETPDRLQELYDELLPLLAAPNHIELPPPVRDRPGASGLSTTFESIQAVRALARSLQAEANQAESVGLLDRAVDYRLGVVRLGSMYSRGGLTVDHLVGIAIEGTGRKDLATMRSRLSAGQMEESLRVLQEGIAGHDSPEWIRQRDTAYLERWHSWPARFATVLAHLQGLPPGTDTTSADLRRLAEHRLLQADLALRLFHHDMGSWPASLDELAPKYLPAVPLDNYSGQPLRYRIEGDDFVLYSVGQDGVDDGGRFGNTTEYFGADGGYDLDLDTYSRP